MSAELLKKYSSLYARAADAANIGADSGSGAYLLLGEDAEGLNVLARLVAARLAGVPEARAFDDFADIVTYPIPPEKKSKGKKADQKQSAKSEMTVDDVHEIVSSLYLTPFELSRRIIIIEAAESMSEVCQNKLLKSLEEPPARVCFVLCATRALLPTVESRCRSVRLPPFSTEETISALSAFHRDMRAVSLAARASRGSLGLAERILADKEFDSTYRTALKILGLCTGSSAFAHAAAVYEKATREKADAILKLMEYLLSDVARLLSGAEPVFERGDVQSISGGFTPYSAARCADIVRENRRRNAGNCMVTAVMDRTVLRIMEEKALCQRS